MSSTTSLPRGLPKPPAAELYHSDVYTWSVEQADALRRRDFAAVDWDNVIEEIESVGRTEERTWTSHCSQSINHLLCIEHYREATDKALRSWSREVRQFRGEMSDAIIENPGLQGKYQTMFANAWRSGRRKACERLAEYDQSNNPQTDEGTALRRRKFTLPEDCPYRLEDVTAFQFKRDSEPRDDVWPPEVARILNTRLHTNYPARYERA